MGAGAESDENDRDPGTGCLYKQTVRHPLHLLLLGLISDLSERQYTEVHPPPPIMNERKLNQPSKSPKVELDEEEIFIRITFPGTASSTSSPLPSPSSLTHFSASSASPSHSSSADTTSGKVTRLPATTFQEEVARTAMFLTRTGLIKSKMVLVSCTDFHDLSL